VWPSSQRHSAASPGLTDVLRGRTGAQTPGDVPAMADLVIRCQKRDLAFSLELAADLAIQSCLVGLASQEEVGLRAPGAVEKRTPGVERVSLNQYALKVE